MNLEWLDEVWDNHVLARRWLAYCTKPGPLGDSIVCLVCHGRSQTQCGCYGYMSRQEAIDYIDGELEILSK